LKGEIYFKATIKCLHRKPFNGQAAQFFSSAQTACDSLTLSVDILIYRNKKCLFGLMKTFNFFVVTKKVFLPLVSHPDEVKKMRHLFEVKITRNKCLYFLRHAIRHKSKIKHVMRIFLPHNAALKNSYTQLKIFM
jgi:hypothetical protein